ncbi:hypothetical protein RFI_24778, partial [Reticulomyxa filosa]
MGTYKLNWRSCDVLAQEDIKPTIRELGAIFARYINKDMTNEELSYIRQSVLHNVSIVLMKREYTFKRFQYDYEMADEVEQLVRQLIQIAIPMIVNEEEEKEKDSEIGMQILYFLLNARSNFYQQYGHDWRQQRGTPLSEEKVKEYEEFRKGIRENVELDYFHENRWKKGTVRQVRQVQNATNGTVTMLDIGCDVGPSRSTLSDKSDNKDNGIVNPCTFDTEHYGSYAPAGTQVKQLRPLLSKWRAELSPKSQCDCMDCTDKWYTCTVVSVDELTNSVKVNYDEWSSKHDEWIPRLRLTCEQVFFCFIVHVQEGTTTCKLNFQKKKKNIYIYVYIDSRRIQKHKSQAKGGKDTGGVFRPLSQLVSKMDEDEDEGDPSDDTLFAVYR